MAKKYFKLAIFVLLMCLLLSGCASYDVAYINENLKNEGFIEMNYNKQIYFGSTLLLEENTKTTLEDDAYKVVTNLKKISSISDENEFIETTNESVKSLQEDLSVKLELKEEFFQADKLKVSKTSLEGTILDSKAEEVLGISNAKSIKINIVLTKNLEVQEIKITYIDTLTEYDICLSTKYIYTK